MSRRAGAAALVLAAGAVAALVAGYMVADPGSCDFPTAGNEHATLALLLAGGVLGGAAFALAALSERRRGDSDVRTRHMLLACGGGLLLAGVLAITGYAAIVFGSVSSCGV